MRKLSLVAALLGSLLPLSATAMDHELLVGVLEDVNRGSLSPGMEGPHVRIAFEFKDGKWSAFQDQYPPEVNWTVVFDGRQLGTIQSRLGVGINNYSGDDGIEPISSAPHDIPHVVTGASDFYYTLSKARSRPLLLVSQPDFHDPQHWKPTTLSPAEKALAIAAFRHQVPRSERCKAPEEGPIHHVRYADSQVAVDKAYRSNIGEVLVGEELADKGANCQFFDDHTFFSYWFLLRRDGTNRFLDYSLTPMDAADLAGTGSSDWIFKTFRGEDRDGYELFYDDFAKSVSFSWTYH